MNSFCKRFFAVLVSLLLFCGTFPAVSFAESASVRSAKIYTMSGDVTIKRGGDKQLTAFEGMRLEEGDTLLTGDESVAEVEIDSDKTVHVDANTEITLDALAGTAQKNSTGISVFFGNIVNAIRNKLTEGSTYETTTSNAVMGVRGTTYLVSQETGKATLFVANGTVAVTKTAAAPETDTAEPVPVSGGSQYECAPEQSEPPTAIRGESLLTLSPGTAKAFVSEDLLAAVTSLIPEADSIESLINLLTRKQEELTRQTRQAVEAKKEEINRQSVEDVSTFYELDAVPLTGNRNSSFTFAQSKNKDTTTTAATGGERVWAGEEAVPSSTLPPPSTSLPQPESVSSEQKPDAPTDSDHGNPGGSTGRPDVPSSKPDVPSSKPDVPSSKPDVPSSKPDVPSSKPDVPSSKPDVPSSKPDVPSSKPDVPSSKPDVPSSEPDTPSDPERQEVRIDDVCIDAVYEDMLNSDARFAGIAVTWTKSALAIGYDWEIKQTNGTFAPFVFPEAVVENESMYRFFLPKELQASLNGSTLRVTPQVDEGMLAVPTEITLQFDNLNPSLIIRKLAKPASDSALLKWNVESEAWELKLVSVKDALSYSVRVYTTSDSAVKFNFDATNPEDGMEHFTLDTPLAGKISIEVQANGDGFNTFSSDKAIYGFSLPQLTKLNTPVAGFTNNSDSVGIWWNKVNHAVGYMIKIRTSDTTFNEMLWKDDLDQMGNIPFYAMDSSYFGKLKEVWIKAIGDGIHYCNSDWNKLDVGVSGQQYQAQSLEMTIDESAAVPLAEPVIPNEKWDEPLQESKKDESSLPVESENLPPPLPSPEEAVIGIGT